MAANGSNPARDGYTGFAEVVVSVSHFGKVAGLVQAGGWADGSCGDSAGTAKATAEG